MSQVVCITQDEQGDARVIFATMDYPDIRGLAPHLISSSQGCLGLGTGIISGDTHIKVSRIPFIVPTHRLADPVFRNSAR